MAIGPPDGRPIGQPVGKAGLSEILKNNVFWILWKNLKYPRAPPPPPPPQGLIFPIIYFSGFAEKFKIPWARPPTPPPFFFFRYFSSKKIKKRKREKK